MEAKSTIVDASHLEASHASDEKMGGAEIIENAKDALQTDHELTAWQCVHAYPMAIFWCLMVSMCVVMEGV